MFQRNQNTSLLPTTITQNDAPTQPWKYKEKYQRKKTLHCLNKIPICRNLIHRYYVVPGKLPLCCIIVLILIFIGVFMNIGKMIPISAPTTISTKHESFEEKIDKIIKELTHYDPYDDDAHMYNLSDREDECMSMNN